MEKISKFKNSLSFKLFIIGFLILVLMIPTAMIAVLVNEREGRQQDAIYEVSEKWGREQTITGPILTIPYRKIYENNVNGVISSNETIAYAHFLPDTLLVNGEIRPETRKRGIYEIVVYNSDLEISGEFSFPDFSKWEISNDLILYDRAFVSLGIPDVRGIKENISLNWNDEESFFQPGLENNEVLSSGVNTAVAVNENDSGGKYKYSLSLSLNGSSDLGFTPIGRTTEVNLNSGWTDPSFQGAYLPENYEINDNGFQASWKVLELNRSFPQSFLGAVSFDNDLSSGINRSVKPISQINSFSSNNFGVRLLIPADEYQKTVRALKYAIMILSLTFLILFFFEAMNKKRVHPLQYILIGLALSLFYVLLLSVSEHLGFNLSYLISGFVTVGLITLYSKSVFGNWRPAIIEALVLVFIYSFIFTILQLKDYALLAGSIGLFVILAVVMYVSRKISWYDIDSTKD